MCRTTAAKQPRARTSCRREILHGLDYRAMSALWAKRIWHLAEARITAAPSATRTAVEHHVAFGQIVAIGELREAVDNR